MDLLVIHAPFVCVWGGWLVWQTTFETLINALQEMGIKHSTAEPALIVPDEVPTFF